MATVQEYLEMLSTSQLKALLREECEGKGSLPTDALLTICHILSQRDPALPTARQMLISLCHCYLEA